MSDFFDRLNLLRKKKDESIIDIATFLHISGPAVHGWKKGGLPKPDKLRLLAEHYGVSVEWLLTGKENNMGSRLADGFSSREVAEEHTRYMPDKCARCAELEAELKEARAVIRDQAAALAALSVKPIPPAAPPVSGAVCGVLEKGA